MNAVIYARFSDHTQREESIEGQIRICQEYAEKNGLTVIDKYIDRAMTGRNDDRPAFQKMIFDSRKGAFQVVLVYQLDRFARNRYDSAINKNTLRRNGVRVISARENISNDASGILTEGILESMAEYYSAELSQKIHRGQKENALKGKNNGGSIPLGYTLGEDQKLVIDPVTAPLVLEIFQRYADGESKKSIVDSLNERGIRTRKGNAFTIGYLGNGATNVILPLTVIALALGLMIGDGTTAYFSLCLGQGNREKAAQGVGNAITLTVAVSILLTMLSLIFLKPLCVLFGATDATMPYALEYGFTITLGFPFYMFSMGFNSIVRADGSPVYAMLSTLSGAILNTILDPVFIFVLHMGVRGAAIATVLGQIVSCIMTLLYLRRFRCITLTPDCLLPRWKLCRRMCSLGISSFFLQLAATIVITVMNNVLVQYGAASKYGAEIPMTTLGITMKVNQIITGIVIGISVGSQPIIGYNYGAGKKSRAQKTYFWAIACSTIVMGIGTLLFQLFPDSIVSIFGSESQLYREFAVKSLRIFLLLILLNGFQLCTGTFFQAIGKPVQATLISLSRQVLFLLPALLILPRFWGVEGALWAGPVGDACAFVLALALGLREWRNTRLSAQETT